jgi:hypothetical protein
MFYAQNAGESNERFHDAQAKASNDAAMMKNYVEYGQRLEKLIGEIGSPKRA